MGKIKKLDTILINQIAAGEVIENPASIVKELVENALDAGALNIDISIKVGGKQSIIIEDDGCGMDKEDLILSVERHATSKIEIKEDLFSLKTMGFRGEALASICAISKLEIITCNQTDSMRLVSEGGEIKSIEIFPRIRGTTVKVNSLFYNVPVRKNFQKSRASCTSEIIRTIHIFSLCYPHISFSFTSEEISFSFPRVNDSKERVKEILGLSSINEMVDITFEQGLVQVKGMIGLPSLFRYHSKGQHLFINQRAVKSSLISSAVREGYGTFLKEKTFPVFVLFLDIPPQWVDVNVHPQKKEVRLLEEQFLHENIEKSIFKALCQEQTQTVQTPVISFEKIPPFYQKREESIFERPIPLKEEVKPYFLFEEPISYLGKMGSFLLVESDKLPSVLKEKASQKSLGIIDLKGVYARCLFESLSKKEKIIERQRLILPLTFDFSLDEMEKIKESHEDLLQMGIELRAVGKNSIAVDAIPSFFEREEFFTFFSKLLSELFGKNRTKIVENEKEKRLCRMISIVSGNKKNFSSDEIQKLIHSLIKCKNPFFCPMGKKTVVFIELEKIDRMFV